MHNIVLMIGILVSSQCLYGRLGHSQLLPRYSPLKDSVPQKACACINQQRLIRATLATVCVVRQRVAPIAFAAVSASPPPRVHDSIRSAESRW